MGTMQLDQDAKSFLQECNKKGVTVCLITDLTSAIQFKKVLRLGIEDMVTFMVTSEEAGAEKPDRRIFEYALLKLGLTKDKVIVIGDDEKKDIYGAKDCNITAYLVKH